MNDSPFLVFSVFKFVKISNSKGCIIKISEYISSHSDIFSKEFAIKHRACQ